MPNYTESERAAEERQRGQIREVMLRHRGSMTEVARSLGIDPINISQYLKGIGRSARVADACKRKAIALLMKEEKVKIDAENRPHDVSVREIIDELRNDLRKRK